MALSLMITQTAGTAVPCFLTGQLDRLFTCGGDSEEEQLIKGVAAIVYAGEQFYVISLGTLNTDAFIYFSWSRYSTSKILIRPHLICLLIIYLRLSRPSYLSSSPFRCTLRCKQKHKNRLIESLVQTGYQASTTGMISHI